jgi:hypothetical protein
MLSPSNFTAFDKLRLTLFFNFKGLKHAEPVEAHFNDA